MDDSTTDRKDSGDAFVDGGDFMSDEMAEAECAQDQVVLELLALWEWQYRQGLDPTPESICAGHPEVIEELRARTMKQKGVLDFLQIRPSPREKVGDSEPAPPTFPGYETLGLIESGGMGSVYKARDLNLGRIVAIKAIAAGRHATAGQVGRFRSEAQAIARLRHPNIIVIHAIGEHAGRPYLALEFAEGGSLADLLAKKPMAPREAAALVEKLAQAVESAHQAEVIHRDLKPSNVLLTADGVPKVSDFGLAKLLGVDSGRTLSGQPIGTPSYMAPEQAAGRPKQVGPAADVYALGAILYETLVGRPPFLGESALETVKLVETTDVVAPRRLRPNVPRDLETICLKCLEKEPLKRYSSALALAEDLRRFRERRPISARPVSLAGRCWRWCKRNPRIAILSAALIASLLVGTLLSRLRAIRATKSESKARLAEAAARKDRDRAESERNQAELARVHMFEAAQAIVLTDRSPMLTEEMRPYRAALIDEGLRMMETMFRELPDDQRSKRFWAQALIAKAKLLAEKGERTEAYAVGRRAVALIEQLVISDQSNTDIRAQLAECLQQLSVIPIEPELARSASQRSNEIYKTLLRESTRAEEAPRWMAPIALNLHNIGGKFFEQACATARPPRKDLLQKAIDALEEGKKFSDELIAKGDQQDWVVFQAALIKRYLCRSYRDLAGQLNDPKESAARLNVAIGHGKRAVSHLQDLVARNPDHFQYAWELCQTQSEIGYYYLSRENRNAAIAAYQNARETLKAMAVKHGKLASRMATIQEQLAVADYNLINVMTLDVVANDRQLRELIDEAYNICEKITVIRPLSPNLRRGYAIVCYGKADELTQSTGLLDIDVGGRAERLFVDSVRENPSDPLGQTYLILVRLELADALAARGQRDEAAAFENAGWAIARGHADISYQAAATFATAARLAGVVPSKLDSQQKEKLRRREARRVVPMLREALAAGYRDASQLRQEPAFETFHSDREFQAIMRDFEFPADAFAKP